MTTETRATLSEQELFARYLQSRIFIKKSLGLDEEYIPQEVLSGNGDCLIEVATTAIADYVSSDENPFDTLLMLVESLEDYTESLRRLLRDFHWLRDEYLLVPDEDAPDEMWDEHNENPRFSIPAIGHRYA